MQLSKISASCLFSEMKVKKPVQIFLMCFLTPIDPRENACDENINK
jgi:hypothetical protein